MNNAQKLVLAFCLAAAPVVSSADENLKLVETATIIDTSIPFAPGAQEHLVNVRGRFDQPSFQQGFFEGMHFRFSPDGGALFSRDQQLRNNLFEVECENGANSCVAIRAAARLGINAEGLLIFKLNADVIYDAIYVGYGLFDLEHVEDNWKRLNTSIDTVSVDLLAGFDQMVAVKDGKLVQQISLEGILVVGAYLKWVRDGQPVKVLPVSWEDSHEETTAPGEKIDINVSIGGDLNFQSEFESEWAIYSPLLQFDDDSHNGLNIGVSRYGDPELGLGRVTSIQDNMVVPEEVESEKQKIQYVVLVEREAVEPLIDLANLNLDELAKLQHQFDYTFQLGIKAADTKKTGKVTSTDLDPYISNLDTSNSEKYPELDQENISDLSTAVSEPQNASQAKNVIDEPKISTKQKVLLASLLKPREMGFSRTDQKKNEPDSTENTCKPAILASVEENVIIKKAMQSKESHAVHDHSAEFSDPSEALKGLPGIYVFTDYLAEPAHLKGKFNLSIHYEIEARLRAGGIRVLSKEELPSIPGQPRMEVYFSKANVETGCSFAVWISVRQAMLLGRDQEIKLLSGTWGSGGAHLREYNDAPEFNTIMNHVDRFVSDYQKANPKPVSKLTQ